MYEDRELFSDKREIIKKKSKGFLRIRHLLWTEQLSAQKRDGPSPHTRRVLNSTESVNVHGKPKDKV